MKIFMTYIILVLIHKNLANNTQNQNNSINHTLQNILKFVGSKIGENLDELYSDNSSEEFTFKNTLLEYDSFPMKKSKEIRLNDISWDNRVDDSELYTRVEDNSNNLLKSLLKSRLNTEITCYSCSSEHEDCVNVNRNTSTCKTVYGCLYIIEANQKVTRHCFIPMPEHNVLSPDTVCLKLHNVYYECQVCYKDYCNFKNQDRFAPVNFGRSRHAELSDQVAYNETVDETDKSTGAKRVEALQVFIWWMVWWIIGDGWVEVKLEIFFRCR